MSLPSSAASSPRNLPRLEDPETPPGLPQSSNEPPVARTSTESSESDETSDDEHTLSAFGDIPRDESFVIPGSSLKQYGLRPKVQRPPMPRKRSNGPHTSFPHSMFLEHLRKPSSSSNETPLSPTSDFKMLFETLRSSRNSPNKYGSSLSRNKDPDRPSVTRNPKGEVDASKSSETKPISNKIPAVQPCSSGRLPRRPALPPSWNTSNP